MDWLDPHILWPIFGSVVAGAVIGFEREYRSSPAGFRTHILVSLSSALLMLAAVHQIRWLTDTPHEIIRIDPVRMAHGILTGIGFLGAGVIFRQGFNIRGLTTAASLWITSSLGILFGVGFYALAVIGTVATVAVLAAVGLTESRLPQRSFVDVVVRFRRGAGVGIERYRAALAAEGLKPGPISVELDEEAASFSASVEKFTERQAAALAAALSADPEVLGLKVLPHER
ncbi:MgtC/SapB family protein [Caulobacter sp. SLTY]|uniref:MgtC/SapB family protein n=1 Tax=Caulobacter sp. SLTY TaxID=2683262 RepID=UPI001412E7AA|nr:MgtC/SapB family protein [Caulobacter sp. SLTY]NBB15863.1 MgtC/SapB family protein [Caulobacter sp. SLTY]